MKYTDLKAKTRNITRWSSTYEYKIILRYTQIMTKLPGQKNQISDSLENLFYAKGNSKHKSWEFLRMMLITWTLDFSFQLLISLRLATLPINAESHMFLRLNINL